MQIFLAKYRDKTLTIGDIDENTTIQEIKHKLINKIPPVIMNYIYFMYGGKILDDNKKIKDYGITECSTIIIAYRSCKNEVCIDCNTNQKNS